MAIPVTLPTTIGKRSKYRAIPTVVNGIRFASKLEAKRYTELRALEATGEIHNLSLQPKYKLHAGRNLAPIGEYRGDFHYYTRATNTKRGESVLEDCKGFKTPLYRWKKKHMAAEYPGVVIVEVTR